MKFFTQINDQHFEFESQQQAGQIQWFHQGKKLDVDVAELGEGRYAVLYNNQSFLVHLLKQGEHYQVQTSGNLFQVLVEDERQKKLKELLKAAHSGPQQEDIKAPIPGLVIKISVTTGQEVKKGDPLLILEAMKMENIIKAPYNARVEKIYITEKEAVQQNQPLVKLISE